MHLSPLLHQICNSAMDRKNPEKKSLEEMTEIVKEKAEIRMLKHQRRMNRIQTKRGSERLNEYLEKISDLYSGAEYDDMTGDEFWIPLFIESADSHMQKIATVLLGTENPTMPKLKVKVKETKNAT